MTREVKNGKVASPLQQASDLHPYSATLNCFRRELKTFYIAELISVIRYTRGGLRPQQRANIKPLNEL